jgi:hypothetical protein
MTAWTSDMQHYIIRHICLRLIILRRVNVQLRVVNLMADMTFGTHADHVGLQVVSCVHKCHK